MRFPGHVEDVQQWDASLCLLTESPGRAIAFGSAGSTPTGCDTTLTEQPRRMNPPGLFRVRVSPGKD
jgi:hypothetical protein